MAQKSGRQNQKEQISMAENDEYNPDDHKAPEVVEHLEDASEEEKMQVAAAEQQGKNRKSVLEAAGVDENVRMDASGRRLHGWEVAPKPADQG